VGIDVWQVKSGTIFSNFLLTDDWETAKAQIDVINGHRDAEKKLKEAETAAAKPPPADTEGDEGDEKPDL